MNERIQRAIERYERACHAVQTGVKFEIGMQLPSFDHPEIDKAAAGPKHLRTGLELRAVDHAALVKVLIANGVIDETAYHEALADSAEAEVARYTKHIENRYGVKVTLL